MRMRFPAVVLLAFLVTEAASADTVFSENFESYSVPSNLPGQGGWQTLSNPDLGNAVVVDVGTGLSSKVAAGLVPPGPVGQQSALHAIAGGFQLNAVYTLTFDAYAQSAVTPAERRSHNGFVGFSDDGVPQAFTVHWQASHFDGGSPGAPTWEFGAATGSQAFAGNFDKPVTLQVVLNSATMESYGRADFDFDGVFEVETTHFPMTVAQFQSLAGVEIYQDFRSPESHVGVEFDNLRVDATPVPLPTTVVGAAVLMAGMGLARVRGRIGRATA